MSQSGDYYESYWQQDGANYRPVHNNEAAEIYSATFPDHDADTLDVGCGDGQAIGAFLSDRSRSYIGVDVSQSAVELARSRGLNATTMTEGAPLPWDDASFDFVACLEVLEHVFATEELVGEMFRVLRPGGSLVVQVPNVAHWRHRIIDFGLKGRFVAMGDQETLTRPWRDPHIRFYTFDAMTRLLEHAGFRVNEVRGIGGNQAEHIPFVGKRLHGTAAGQISHALFRLSPGFFANRILVAALR